MDKKQKNLATNVLIITGPILAIVTALSLGIISEEMLARWDVAIGVGAMITLIVFLFRKKK